MTMATTFFYLSKILWFFTNPFHFFILLVFCGLALLYLKWMRCAKVLLTFATLCMLVITIYPVGDILMSPLEQRFSRPQPLPEKIDGIIILGGSVKQELSAVWNTLESNSGSERITKAVALANQYPEAKVVFTGGSGLMQGTPTSEAEIAEKMLLDLGVKRERLLLEDGSKNTYQNATLSKKLLDDNIDGNWLLVTSAFHMPRSVGVFHSVGWKVIPYPVDYRSLPAGHRRFRFDYEENMVNLKYALHEWIGLAAYFYTEKTRVFFPE